jgi:outer membrane lipoprotein SlyB
VGPGQPTQAVAAPGYVSGAGATTATAEPPKKDLTLNKVIAGAGAASASAVFGSFFGAMGTVAGAAVGSIFSAVVTTAMEKSLDKTRDTVKARVKLPGGRTVDVVGKTEVPVPPTAPGGETGSAHVVVTPGDRPTELLPAATGAGPDATQVAPAPGAPRSRRRLLVMTGFTVVIFALGMLAITGLELVKGSPLNTGASTAQRPGGTSLGTVLGGDAGAAATETTEPTATESESETEEPSEDEDRTSAESTSEEDAEQTDERRSGDEDEPTPTRSSRSTPTPTPEPGPGSDSDTGGGAAPNAQPGAGAEGDAGTNGAG